MPIVTPPPANDDGGPSERSPVRIAFRLHSVEQVKDCLIHLEVAVALAIECLVRAAPLGEDAQLDNVADVFAALAALPCMRT